jgi:hypothetical protein
MNRHLFAATLAVAGLFTLNARPALAIFHLWDFAEVFSNSDGSVQFIELVNPTATSTETGATTAHLHSLSTGKTYFFPNNLSGSTANKRLLIATAGFGSLPGGVAPDFPTLALPANFFNPAGDTISLLVNCCGAVDTKTFASVPTDGVMSRNYPANTLLTNSPTNFAGVSGSVNLSPTITPTGDYNGNGTVDAADYAFWRDRLDQTVTPNGSGADGDADGAIDAGDYDFWRNNFGDVVMPGAGGVSVVPEPAALTLVVFNLLTWAITAARAKR